MPRRDFDPQLDRMERDEARAVAADEAGIDLAVLAEIEAEADREATEAAQAAWEDEQALQALWDTDPHADASDDGPQYEWERGWR